MVAIVASGSWIWCAALQVALVVPLCAGYLVLQRTYSSGATALRRREAVSRRPTLEATGDALAGLVTLKAFQKEALLWRQLLRALRGNAIWTAAVNNCSAWLGFRGNVIIYSVIATVSSILFSALYQPGPGSMAPLVLSSIFQIGGGSPRGRGCHHCTRRDG